MAVTLGRKIDALEIQRAKIRKMNEQVDIQKAKYTEMADDIMDIMEKQDVFDSTGKRASVHYKLTDVANVKDWDKVYNYIKRHNAFHIMFRRVADAAWREECETARGHKIPGIETFSKRSLNLRSL